jgi:2'-5' RNA ligase
VDERKRRLFAGVELDDGARAACCVVSEILRATGFDARYEAAGKLHVTLAFLGNVSASQADAIAGALREAAGQQAPFELRLDKLGAFPHERKPRVVYIGSREQGAPFRGLAHAVRRAFSLLGFSFDEDPVAHVTIARVKEPRRALPLVEFAPVVLRIAALSLFESLFDAGQKTSRYEVTDVATLAS